MTLDEELFVEDLRRQLNKVVPGFFNKEIIAVRYIVESEKKWLRRTRDTPNPRVVASTGGSYPIGSILEVNKFLVDLIRQDYNVFVFPKDTRQTNGFSHEKPEERLIAAEVDTSDPYATDFGDPIKFHISPTVPKNGGFRDVNLRLTESVFETGVKRENIYFAFVKRGKYRRG